MGVYGDMNYTLKRDDGTTIEVTYDKNIRITMFSKEKLVLSVIILTIDEWKKIKDVIESSL